VVDTLLAHVGVFSEGMLNCYVGNNGYCGLTVGFTFSDQVDFSFSFVFSLL